MEKSVRHVDGVCDVSVNLLNGSMVVDYDDTTSPDKIVAAVVDGGYGAELASQSKKDGQRDAMAKHIAWMKKRLIISVVFLIPLFYIAMGHMMNWPLPGFLHPTSTAGFYRFVAAQVILLIPILIVNWAYFSVGFKRLFQAAPNMDSLVALGATAGIVYSAITVVQGHASHMPELYFESAGMILALVTVGKYLEARSKGKTGEAIASLIALAPESAVVLRDGKEITLPIGEVAVGDTVVVRQGGRIPVDGTVLSGHGAAIAETARLTDRRIELDEDTKAMLDLKQQILADRIAEHPEISVVWFRADKKKDGGQYVTTTGQLKKVDDIERTLRLVDGTTIPLDDVLELRSDCFHGIFQDG